MRPLRHLAHRQKPRVRIVEQVSFVATVEMREARQKWVLFDPAARLAFAGLTRWAEDRCDKQLHCFCCKSLAYSCGMAGLAARASQVFDGGSLKHFTHSLLM
jgi:hypothetical protein